ncbi:MAG: SRPBCC family protein [Maribacter sp.]|nr:SRPBCC family protein [Maribacter sp.]
MKYTTQSTVNLARDEFIKKLDDTENMKHWQPGLVGYSILSGKTIAAGARIKLRYKLGKRTMVLVETIIKRNLPFEFHASDETKGVHDIQKNYFKDIDGSTTEWISEYEFQVSGFKMKAIALQMPSAFKKQSLKYVQNYKAFAEKGMSVAKQPK